MATESNTMTKDFNNVAEKSPIVWKTNSLGFTHFDQAVSVKECMDAIGDFNVNKEHLFKISDEDYQSIVENGHSMIDLTEDSLIKSHMATVRDDNNATLGVVGAGYGVVQNSKAFEFIDLITSGELGGSKAVIEDAGILNGGKRMFVEARIENDLYISKDDAISDYILFTNSHDGSCGVQAFFTPIRVICNNTLNAAIKGAKNKLTYKHSSGVNQRLDFSKEENIERAITTLRLHEKFKEEFIAKLRSLSTEQVASSETDVMKFASKVLCTPAQYKLIELNNFNAQGVEEISTKLKNQLYAMQNAVFEGVGQEQYKGTKLWLYNGVTTYFQNGKGFTTEGKKLDSILEGSVQGKVQKAYDLLTA